MLEVKKKVQTYLTPPSALSSKYIVGTTVYHPYILVQLIGQCYTWMCVTDFSCFNTGGDITTATYSNKLLAIETFLEIKKGRVYATDSLCEVSDIIGSHKPV